MKAIKLTQGQVAWVDDEDYEWLMQWKWHYSKNGNTGYARRKTNGKHMYMHTLIVNTPEGLQVDHIDQNGLNNQKSNLRICTHAQNEMNSVKQKNNSSGYKGVSWDGNAHKWRACIRKDRSNIHLGLFELAINAARAYDEASIIYHGEFANINGA